MKIGKKFDIVLMNPPYGDRSNGGMFIDMQFVEKCNQICNHQIVIHPANRWVSNTKVGKTNAESKHLKSLTIVDANKIFNISVEWKYAGIFEYDNTNEYEETQITNLLDKIDNVRIDDRFDYFDSIKFGPDFLKIIINHKDTKKQLIEKYKTMVNDGHGFIYEENRLERGKRPYGVIKNGQQSLSRVKTYLKEGKYKYCLYKGSFNNDYDEVQEWKGQDPDKLFKGQICWLTNKENVKNNIKYWLECPLCDMWRKYKFGKTSTHCSYGNIPALDFEMDEDTFKEYVDTLNEFDKEEIKVLKKYKVHNADKL